MSTRGEILDLDMRAGGGVIVACALLLSGGIACMAAPNYPGPVIHMQSVDTVNTAPGADEAVVVFLRPKGVAGAIQAAIFEVEEPEPAKFIGLVAAMKKVAYRTTAGRHVFMVVSEDADFITANLEAGKVYYVVVKAEGGTWKSNFALKPVRAFGHAALAKPLAETAWVAMTADSLAWARENAKDIEEKQLKSYRLWLRKPSFERLALFPDDGR